MVRQVRRGEQCQRRGRGAAPGEIQEESRIGGKQKGEAMSEEQEGAALATVGDEPRMGIMAMVERAPETVLAEAHKAAAALQSVIASKARKVVMNGEQYLEFEDWQLVGRFYGVTAAAVGEPEFVQLGEVCGFKATSVALLRGGSEISRATAFCMSDEEKWSTRTKYAYAYCLRNGGHSIEDPGPSGIVWVDNPGKPGKKMPKKERINAGEEKVPLFQLASMAQTRANSKVLRNVLSWVVVLAGYRPTPAEELDGLAQTVEHKATPPEVPTIDVRADVPGSTEAKDAPRTAAALGSIITAECDGDADRAKGLLEEACEITTLKGLKGKALEDAWRKWDLYCETQLMRAQAEEDDPFGPDLEASK
jgi:hypothetical protein